jgi:hypothetical protein
MQMNSYEFRHKWGEENKKRRFGRIIVTCPPGMSKIEQIALRKCCEDAAILLDRFYSSEKNNINELANIKIQIIPDSKSLRNRANRNEWIYDEATCPQFVYLFAELTKRYRNNSVEYFDFYGKVRNDLGDYNKKSITIGSVDIGAGTTDLMIASYKYDDASECTLTPVPLFWESFYIAGDDLLKNLPAGFQDVVLYDQNENAIETARCNLYLYDAIRDLVVTPKLEVGCLNGVLRRALLAEGAVDLPKLGYKNIIEENIKLSELKKASNLYIGNAVSGLLKAQVNT